MTLSKFIDEVKKEMEANGWQNKPITFNTSDRDELGWLSIYETGGIVHFDIGKSDE